MMIVAAGLLGVSMMDKVERKIPGFDSGTQLPVFMFNGMITHQYGWPFVVYETIYDGEGPGITRHGQESSTWKPTALWLDALIALGLLSGVAVMAEWLIRRREGRKP